MVNTSTFRTGIYQHDFSHTFSCFSLPFSKCGHTQVTERSGRPVTWMKCWHFMFLQTNSNVLFITPAFIQCVPNHVHTTCLWDDFHDGRWTGRSLASTASWDGGQAGDHCFRQQFNICKRARTGFLTRRRDIFQLSLWRRNMIFPLSHQVVFAPRPFAHQCHNMQLKSISVNILAKIYSGHWVTDDSPVNVLVSMSHVMWLVLHRCLCSVRPDEAGILANGLCSHNVHLISN